MLRRKLKVNRNQRKLLLDMMMLHRVFNLTETNLIEVIYATGYYTKEQQDTLNDIRQRYIEHERIYTGFS